MTEIERLKKQLANALARAAAAETQKKIARLAKTEACWQLKLLKERVRLIDDTLAGGSQTG